MRATLPMPKPLASSCRARAICLGSPLAAQGACAHGVRWIETRSFISYDGERHPRHVIGVNIDVTERKQTEALLTESKALLSAGQVVAFEWDAATGRSQRTITPNVS